MERDRSRRKFGKPTLSDVARAANVSEITASRALRNPAIVSKALRERIERAVREIGYVPNTAARALASAHTNVIGVIIPSVTNSVFTDVLRGIYDAVEATPYQVQLGNTNYSTMQEEQMLRLFLGQRPAGLLVTGHDQSPEARTLLKANNCPVVQIMDLPPDPVDMAVGFSHADAAEAATQHMIDQGYKRIGYIAAQMDVRTRARLEGYTQTLTRHGLFDERLIVTTHKPSSVHLGTQLCAEFLARNPDADALQTNNDDITLGALFECKRRRMRMPQEFGIAGFHDFEFMSVAHPTVTSVRTFRYEMGKRGFEMLVDAIAGRRPDEPVVDMGFELEIRQSTARRRS